MVVEVVHVVVVVAIVASVAMVGAVVAVAVFITVVVVVVAAIVCLLDEAKTISKQCLNNLIIKRALFLKNSSNSASISATCTHEMYQTTLIYNKWKDFQ